MVPYQVIVCFKDYSHRCIAVMASESDPTKAIDAVIARLRKEGADMNSVHSYPYVLEGSERPVVENL